MLIFSVVRHGELVVMPIFFEDFERTENSDEIFGVMGRALVIATRFDSMCKTLARAIDLKFPALLQRISDSDFESLIEKSKKKYSTLDKSIKKIELSRDLFVILDDARKARNAVVHDLAIGLEGCVDTKLDEVGFLSEVSKCIFDLARGEVLISNLIQVFNGEEPMRSDRILAYRDGVVSWVIEK